MKQHLKLAIKAASRSTFRQRVGCVIFSRSSVLETGTNSIRHQGAIHNTGHWQASLHAELDACAKMVRAGRARQLIGASILVVRLKKNNELGLAMPCKDCYNLLQKLGVRKIFFSNNEQGFSEIIL